MSLPTYPFLDAARRLVDASITYPPESGGALLGPPGRRLITRFVYDGQADATDGAYWPSADLATRVQEVERDEGLELKGMVHSHPGRLARLSLPDRRELSACLDANPHLTDFVAAIVTRAGRRRPDRHELPLESGRISFFLARRQGTLTAAIARLPIREVPMQRDLERICDAFGAIAPPEIFTARVGGAPLPAGRIRLSGIELLLLFSDLYPAAAPLLLVTDESGETRQSQLPWRLDIAEEDRLVAALRAVIDLPEPYHYACGPPGGPALTAGAEHTERGWTPIDVGGSDATAESFVRALTARTAAMLPADFLRRRALVAGLGSVGSYIAEQLVRAGIGGLTLLDPESVETANLSRTVYEAVDVGRPKTQALARRLLQINPSVDLRLHAVGVYDLPPKELLEIVQETDLVVAATDDPRAQLALNRFSYLGGRPAVFVGLYAGAEGGEVIFTLPERTACYLCSTTIRHGLSEGHGQLQPEIDYGTGRLTGQVALAADIHHVSSAAVKIILALFPNSPLQGFLAQPLARGQTYLTLSTVAGYWFYPSLFGDVPGQHAYQAVWLQPTRRDDCPVCGLPEQRVGLLDAPLRTPRVRLHAAP